MVILSIFKQRDKKITWNDIGQQGILLIGMYNI